jgi:hypothetical protein
MHNEKWRHRGSIMIKYYVTTQQSRRLLKSGASLITIWFDPSSAALGALLYM